MQVLVLGSGGREHAIVKALLHSPSVKGLHVNPGSSAMALEAIQHNFDLLNEAAWTQFLKKNPLDLVVVGPEFYLAQGVSDLLRKMGVPTFGPSQEAALLESSKIFSKKFMDQAGVPTAKWVEVTSKEQTLKSAEQFTPPYVLKADGLAAGKGVFICKDLKELEESAIAIFDKQILGEAGRKAILEQSLQGEEISYLILTNGEEFTPLPLAQDHKRLLDKDLGPNTGGMGVVAPVPMDNNLRNTIHEIIVQRTLKEIRGRGLLYRGVLYIGLMITKEGPFVLEYNVRFGDPEAQVLLPLLDADMGEVFLKIAQGNCPKINFKPLSSACVVLAAPGYPDKPEKNVVIEGDPRKQSASSYFLHAGTSREASGQWLTSGGRVLNAIGLGSTVSEALAQAYSLVKEVTWRGIHFRKDIGQKQIGSNQARN